MPKRQWLMMLWKEQGNYESRIIIFIYHYCMLQCCITTCCMFAERNEVEPKKEKSTGSDGIATAQSNVIAETRGFVRTATPMPRIKTLIMMEQQSAGSSQTTLNTMEQYSAMPSQETLRM